MPDFRVVRINAFELKRESGLSDYTQKRLLDANFVYDREIYHRYVYETDQYEYAQEISPRDFLFLKFDTGWVPKWKKDLIEEKRIKELLLMKLR